MGRVVLVTGGSRGIGRALVERFTRAGDEVAATSRTETGARASGAALPLVCDVADRRAVDQMVAEVVQRLGRLDVLINNAGVAGENSLDPDDDDALWHRIVDVNLHGTWYASRAALPHLPDESGRVVNVASVLALRGVPDQTAYCAAKHGVLGFTRALALAVAPRGITVNALCPGWVRTDMAEQRAKELGTTVEALGRSAPSGRMAEPEEVAELAFFVASAKAGHLTGQALPLDGGMTA